MTDSMSQTMIERVALAIAFAIDKHVDEWPSTTDVAEALARAALAAMREPTEGIVKTGVVALEHARRSFDDDGIVRAILLAANAAALEGK